MSTELACLQKTLSTGSIGSYIHWTNQIPMLSLEEEQSLATRLKTHDDIEAARRLILSHLRFVVKIARGYKGYGLAEADLIQEGNIGLMKAVRRFDPEVGVRLVTFAVHWIRAEIHEFILRNWRIVKIATTKAQRKLFFNIRKAAKKLSWLSDSEVAIVAEELNVKPKEVRQMEMRLNAHDQSFDAVYDDDSDKDTSSWSPAAYLESSSPNPEHLLEHQDWNNNQEKKLQHALLALDDRSRDILHKRWLDDQKATLHDLAAEYNVSAERIRQLEKNAMQKLRQAIAQ